jgi:hypothetical protein
MHEENRDKMKKKFFKNIKFLRNIEFTTNKNSTPNTWLLGMFRRNLRKSKNLNLANLCDLILIPNNELRMESKIR